jgi:DNA-directed RNA polymerase subunit F
MKVLLINEGTLTDFEVYKLVQERRESRLHKNAMVTYAERNWMDHKVLKFLGQNHSHCSTLDENKIYEFLTKAQKSGFELTDTEKLQFINHCPTEVVDVHVIIEDCHNRFTEDQVDELLQIVESTLALDVKKRNEEEEDESSGM